jgi:hypothetical protein
MTGWIKYFGFAVMLFLISGCSSVERLNPDDVNALGQIDVSTASQRSDQIFRQNLNLLLARHPQGDIRYHLTSSISQSQSDTSTTVKLTYALYDQKTGETVISESLSLNATFGAVSSLYGQDIAATQAQERLAKQLSEQVYMELLAYFTNRDLGE